MLPNTSQNEKMTNFPLKGGKRQSVADLMCVSENWAHWIKTVTSLNIILVPDSCHDIADACPIWKTKKNNFSDVSQLLPIMKPRWSSWQFLQSF